MGDVAKGRIGRPSVRTRRRPSGRGDPQPPHARVLIEIGTAFILQVGARAMLLKRCVRCTRLR